MQRGEMRIVSEILEITGCISERSGRYGNVQGVTTKKQSAIDSNKLSEIRS